MRRALSRSRPTGPRPRQRSRDDAWRASSGPLPDPRQLVGDPDQVGQGTLRLLVLPRLVRLVALDVDPQRRPRRPGAGEAVDDTRAVLEHDADALVGADRAVDRVDVGE